MDPCHECGHQEPKPTVSPYAHDDTVSERLRELLILNHADAHAGLAALMAYVQEAHHAGFAEALIVRLPPQEG